MRDFLSKNLKLLQTTGFVLLFSLFGFFANYFSVPLFFGVDFIHGSIIVMMAIVLIGRIPAIIVATFTASYTLLLWGHPYALLGFVLEAIFVVLVYRKLSNNLVLIDFIYWLFIGSPLVLHFYTQHLGMDFDTALFIALKQSLNGVINTLVAGILILILQLKWGELFPRLDRKIRIKDINFYVFLTAIVLSSSTPVIYDGYHQRFEKEKLLYTSLNDKALVYFENIRYYLSHNEVILLDYFHFKDVFFKMKNGDNDAEIYAYGTLKSETDAGEKQLTSVDGLNIWLPYDNLSVMKRWKKGVYYATFSSIIDKKEYQLTLEYPAVKLAKELEKSNLQPFVFLNFMTFFGIVLSFFVSRRMSAPLFEISHNSKKIFAHILLRKDLKFTSYAIKEYSDLQDSLKRMYEKLLGTVEELEIEKNQAKELSRVDVLTGIYNRRAFMDSGEVLLNDAIRYKTDLSLIMLDIDFFKKINDTYGHEAGDLVLVNLTKKISGHLRKSDLFARIGGEEFTILLSKTNAAQALEKANQLLKEIRKFKTIHEDRVIDITVSMGISECLNETCTIDSLLKHADEALYRAKKNGRNRVIVSERSQN